MDDHRKWVRNCHVGLACLMKLAVVRSNVVVTDKPNSPGYGDSFIMSPQGEIIAATPLPCGHTQTSWPLSIIGFREDFTNGPAG